MEWTADSSIASSEKPENLIGEIPRSRLIALLSSLLPLPLPLQLPALLSLLLLLLPIAAGELLPIAMDERYVLGLTERALRGALGAIVGFW